MKKILLTLLVVLIFVLSFCLQFFIKVKIICKSQYGDCPKLILENLSRYNGKSLFNAKKGIEKILSTQYSVSDYSLQYKISNTLYVELLVKKPDLAFKNVNSETFALVDSNGEVLSIASSSALPVIIVIESLPKEGENIGKQNLFALKLVNGVYQMYQAGSFLIQDGSLLVELPGQFRVIFPLDGDSDVLLGTLRLVYSKVQNEENRGKYKEVDLRFSNPVLR